jgi:hypothetical protein
MMNEGNPAKGACGADVLIWLPKPGIAAPGLALDLSEISVFRW